MALDKLHSMEKSPHTATSSAWCHRCTAVGLHPTNYAEAEAVIRSLADSAENFRKAVLEGAARLLEKCAEGRDYYRGTFSADDDAEWVTHVKTVLDAEANTLRNAARIVRGGETEAYGLLPSHMWTDAMDELLRHAAKAERERS